MENNRFEDSFRNAFDGAEVSPSGGVWTNIELSLEKSSGSQLKRNLLMFQLLAAASVVFACGIVALYYLESKTVETQKLSEEVSGKSEEVNKNNQQESIGEDKKNSTAKDFSRELIQPKSNNSQVEKTLADRFDLKRTSKKDNSLMRELANETTHETSREFQESVFKVHKIEKRELSSLNKTTLPKFVLPAPEKSEADPGMIMLARLKDEEKKYQQEEKKKSNENLWASVGFGAGSYKPNRQVLSNNNSVTGESYSVGLNVTSKISKRIVLQGGVSYLSQNANFISTATSQDVAMFNELNSPGKYSLEGGIVTDGSKSYTINSSLQFVSIPLQAGYIIVDRAFGIQVNGGISTDLFINNTLKSENGGSQKITQTAGSESPYRTVNFSGLMGTEFSYRIADQYRISLNPGLRYSLNSIYKEDIAATITPFTFDVSLRFRYIFK